jgi:hypothetical protein
VLAAGEAPDEDLEKGGRSPCRRRLAASKERARMGGGTPKKDSGGKEREDATALGSILGRKAREAFSFLFLSSHCNGKLLESQRGFAAQGQYLTFIRFLNRGVTTLFVSSLLEA